MAFGMNFFRKYQGRLLLVLTVFLMLTWFVGGALMRMMTPEPAAGTMFGEDVPVAAYEQAQRVLELISFGKRPPDEDIWRFLVIEHEADKYGVEVSDEEVTQGLRQWIMQLPGANNENIDDLYRSVLSRLRTNDQTARFAMSRNLRAGKILSMVAGARIVTDAEAWLSYVRDRVELRLKYMRVPADEFAAQVPKPDESALAAYYAAHKDAYMIPAQATVEYIGVLKSDAEKLFPVTDEEISAYYESHKEEDYLLPLEKEAGKIGSTGSDLSEESARAIGSSDSDLPEGGAPSADPAASDPPAPEISSTESAIAAQSDTQVQFKPLAAVADEIRAKLAEQKANGMVTDAQVDALQQKDTPLKDIAANYGLPYKVVGPFTEADKGVLEKLADAKSGEGTTAAEQIFRAHPTEVQYASSDAGYFLFKVASFEDAKEPAPADVRQRLDGDYVKAEAERLAMAEAARILDDLKVNGWTAYERQPKYDVTETGFVTRAKVEGIFQAAAPLADREFGGPVAAPDGAYDFQVLQRKEPELGIFEDLKNLVKLYRFTADKQEFVRDWEDDLVARAAITSKMTTGRARPEGQTDNVPYY